MQQTCPSQASLYRPAPAAPRKPSSRCNNVMFQERPQIITSSEAHTGRCISYPCCYLQTIPHLCMLTYIYSHAHTRMQNRHESQRKHWHSKQLVLPRKFYFVGSLPRKQDQRFWEVEIVAGAIKVQYRAV